MISEHIQKRLNLARNWVTSEYTPDHLRIELKEKTSPNVINTYDTKIRDLVVTLGIALEKTKWTEEEIKHKMINLREDAKLSRKEMNQFFRILYQIFLGSTKGPRFAPFIVALDREWVIQRLQEIKKS
jgi:lysyl-tRNA synthetase class I